ncbi:MAG: bifunctional phosphoribosyl-AMP cyclohydrolase/phosphoribosyl-ATP diphosphatase HisIE [Gammaproteobacteria bacterium]|nr:bifunctional phosphoribosyl-AMP cyclohydrolase/phosphoribosyl-ATP diphosphatase HisIE [Gammaproteobacteria bacterium]
MQLDWKKMQGLLPAIVQDAHTRRILMLGYMNQEALRQTLEIGEAVFYSRSKRRLWRKGETSGNVLSVKSVVADCDGDTLLVIAEPSGPVCHLGAPSCFESNPDFEANGAAFLEKLENVIADRKTASPDSSYTARLFASGANRIAQKLGEEAVETVLAGASEDASELVNEAADLIYHLLVLLQARDVSLTSVTDELAARHRA